jgi:ubiquinone/menaquinone biosynthesis C-methylase UbiE
MPRSQTTADPMSKTLVQQQFGAHAAAYVTSAVHAKGASLARVVELVQPSKDWHALDVATGAGHMALAFAPHVAHVVASDITREMLDQTAGLAARQGHANVETAMADAEALPFADARFDLVSCRIAPHHFADVPRFIAEAARVLKSGGTFALVDNIAPDAETTPGFAADELAAADVVYNLFEKVRDPSHGRALTASAWRGLLAGSGLHVCHQEVMDKAMPFTPWVKQQSVPPENIARLEAMVANGNAALRTFLKPAPTGDGGDWQFTLRELVLIARKS